jgi:hypothetical protein
VLNKVTKLRLVLYKGEHHQHVASVTYKDIRELNVDQSNLSLVKISDNLHMWLLSNCALSRTRFGGVAGILMWPAY